MLKTLSSRATTTVLWLFLLLVLPCWLQAAPPNLTAPYTCPKSSLILANARNQMVGELLADLKASIPASEAAPGTQLIGRLQAVSAP